ncbi:MAG: TPM domain-containing protein [Myxococcota bacterium]|jgi:putative membrane protein|nr:TPM domain-containing protein [Myxococcota bacterium]
MSLVSESEAAEIEKAIARIEGKTSSELVVAVIEQSHDYAGPRALFAFGWTLAATLALHYFVEQLSSWWLIPLEVPIGLALYALLGLPALRRLTVPRAFAEEAVQARAFSVFAERGLHRTRDRTGLLILLSELEHRVVILGDTGIHELVGDSGWQEHVARIVERVREGKAAQGILECLDALEPLLAQKAPRREDDENELEDRVIRG